MRKYIIVFFSGLLLLFACSKTPGEILKPDVMANLLTDIHLTDGSMINIPQIPDSIYKYGMGSYLQVFKKYNTDSAQFRKSYRYYTYHPDELVNIYDEVLKKLTLKSDSVTALIAKNNKAQMKKNNQANPAGGKFVPPNPAHPQPGQLMHPPLPAKPGVPANNISLKQQMLQRMRAHRDSMIKKNTK